MRNLKAFGLMLVAAFALSAVVASTASAEFTIGETNAHSRTTALAEQVFTAGPEATVKCKKVAGDGTTTNTTEKEITIEPTYSECQIAIGSLGTLTAEIDTNGCHYLFTTNTEVAVHVLCPEGKQIEVTAKILGTFRKCLDVHAQTPTSPVVHYTNKLNTTTGKWDIEINPTVEGITYEKTGSCAFGTVEGNDSTYSGKVTVEALNGNNEPINLTHSLFAGE